jgi:integrase
LKSESVGEVMKLRQMPFYETNAQGQKVKRMSTKWYAVFADWSETLRRLPLLENKKASTEIARKIERLNSIRAGGDVMTADLTRYVETMPPGIRTKLAEWGILSAARVAAGKPLVEHIADWRRALLAKGNTECHAELVTSRTSRAFDACGFKLWTDISASRLHCQLADLRKDHEGADGNAVPGISAQTFNFYLQACKQFCRWMVHDGRGVENPLAHLQGLNVKTDRRHDRRALSHEELRCLLEATELAAERFGMPGSARALLYRLAVETGLRVAELRSLTRGSFVLDGAEPNVMIAAAYAKNRRQDTLPLKLETATLLKTYMGGKMPAAKAFDVPPPSRVVKMFRADLAEARGKWVASNSTLEARQECASSSFLAYRDDAGRVIDFHALRHTFISNLAAGGVHPKTAQTLARHSTITLTMDRYSHIYRGDLASALKSLPDLSQKSAQAMAATGTDKICLSPDLSPEGEFGHNSTESGGVKAASVGGDENLGKTKGNQGFFGGDVASWRGGRVAEGDGLLNRYTGSNPYPGFESPSLRFFFRIRAKSVHFQFWRNPHHEKNSPRSPRRRHGWCDLFCSDSICFRRRRSRHRCRQIAIGSFRPHHPQ